MAQERFSQTMTLPSYAANPVSDRAGLISNDVSQLAGTLGFVSEVAGEAMKYSAMSEVEQSIKKDIEDYQKQSPTYLAQTNLDVKTMQDKLNDPSLKESEIPGIVKSINDKVNFLQTARDQRKINDYEFTSRINQVTREALAKNPGFSREILSKAQQTLDLNNIQQTIKLDAALYESQRKTVEEERRNLRELGEKYLLRAPEIVGEDGQKYLDYAALDREVTKAMNDERTAKGIERLATTTKNINEIQLQEIVNNGIHWSVVNDSYRSGLSQFNTLMKDPSVPLDKKITTLDLLANQMKLDFNTKFGRFYNKPEIKEAADFYTKQIDGVVTALKNDSTGKNYAEILETNSKINTKLSELELRNMGIDPVYTKVLGDLAPYLNKFNLNPKTENTLINWSNLVLEKSLQKMQKGDSNPKNQETVDNVFQKGTITLQNGEKVSINAGYLNSSANNISKGDATVVPVFKQSLDNYIAYINFDSDFLSTKDRQVQQKKQFGAMEEMFKQIGDPKFKEAAKYIDGYQASQLLKGVDEYNRVIYNNFMKYRAENPNEKVRISQNWDGTLIATGGSEEFNTNYVGRINTALKAYSTLQGKSPNEVSNEFYSRYYQDIFTKNVSELSMKVKPVEEGNIDLKNRPVVKNTDGTISTVRSMSFRMGNTEILVPTVSDDGKILTENEAIKRYLDTGKHLGKFRTAEEATTFAKQLHNEQDKMYSPGNTLDNFSTTSGGGADKKVGAQKTSYMPKFITEANAGEVDNILVKLAQKESGGLHINPTTRQLVESPKGAKGVTQVMPATGVDPGYGVQPLRDQSEVEYKRFSRDYFVAMLKEFNGDVGKALAAYNYGPVNVKSLVKKHGDSWYNKLPSETKDYVASIL
jgi:hypothetical protein